MKLRTIVCNLVMLISIAFAPEARATLLVYEPFDYPVGSLRGNNGGIGLSDVWSSDFPTVQNANLGVGSYQGTGKMVFNPGGRALRGVNQTFGADGTELWISFLMRIDSRPAQGSYFTGLRFAGLFVGLPTAPVGTTLTTWGSDSPPNQYMSQVPIVLGQAALLVVHMTSLPEADKIDLYVNPIPGSVPAVPDVTRTDLDFSAASQRIHELEIGGVGATTSAFDELRMGTTYADVVPVPEPSGLVLAGISVVLFALRGLPSGPLKRCVPI